MIADTFYHTQVESGDPDKSMDVKGVVGMFAANRNDYGEDAEI